MNSYTEKSPLLKRQQQQFAAAITRPAYTTAYHPIHLGRLLNQVAHGVLQWFTDGSMLRVSRVMQRGQEVWKVYDPITSRTRYFVQEDDLRVWMEERYYQ